MQKRVRGALLVPTLALLAAGCAGAPGGQAAWRDPTAAPSTLQFMEEAERLCLQTMKDARIPGMAVAITTSAGTLWEEGFGFADEAGKVPVTPQTRFSIQSMSKIFAAVGVLAGVRDGLVDLDSPVTRWLPAFTVQSAFEERPEQRITLRHLLSHTAGFTHEAPVGNNHVPGEPSFDAHLASIPRTWLRFRVGERQAYDNLSIDLAAGVVQAATGRPWVTWMEEEVLGPLGLTRTTYDVAVVRADRERAIGRQFGFPALPTVVPMVAAGGIWSSAHDLQAFVRFLLREGRDGGILPPSAFAEMETTPAGGSFGLAIAVGRRGEDIFFNHGGSGYGFQAQMEWYPTHDVGIVVLTNSADHPAAHVALARSLVGLMIDRGIAKRKRSLSALPVNGITLSGDPYDAAFFAAHAAQAAWKDAWTRYLGTWQLPFNSPPAWYVRLAVVLGFPRSTYVRIERRGSGITLDGVPMLEHLPGLFLTRDGEAMDFRGDPPTWRNIPVTRR